MVQDVPLENEVYYSLIC